MSNLKFHGAPPFRVAVIHGGPGAPGAVRLMAEEIGRRRGALEPFQGAGTLDGQVDELRLVLEEHAAAPAILVGSSWGGWLSYLTAARHPNLVSKLILVGAPPFEDWQARDITATRLRRLGDAEREEAETLLRRLGDPAGSGKNEVLAKIGRLFAKADSVNPLTLDMGIERVDFRIHSQVWKEATRLRARGELLAIGRHVRCPVVAIHGDRDPHPAEGVQGPLSSVVKDFRFILLQRCGHFPWLERDARDAFYGAIETELS